MRCELCRKSEQSRYGWVRLGVTHHKMHQCARRGEEREIRKGPVCASFLEPTPGLEPGTPSLRGEGITLTAKLGECGLELFDVGGHGETLEQRVKQLGLGRVGQHDPAGSSALSRWLLQRRGRFPSVGRRLRLFRRARLRLRPLNTGSRGDDPNRDYGMELKMADMNKFSEQVIDLAERFADITDAAQGKGNRKSMGARWLIIPAAGAGLYALGASGSFKAQRQEGHEPGEGARFGAPGGPDESRSATSGRPRAALRTVARRRGSPPLAGGSRAARQRPPARSREHYHRRLLVGVTFPHAGRARQKRWLRRSATVQPISGASSSREAFMSTEREKRGRGSGVSRRSWRGSSRSWTRCSRAGRRIATRATTSVAGDSGVP